MNNNYQHLYNTGTYVPPSVIRKIEEATPGSGSNSAIGLARVNGNQAIGGVSEMNNLINRKLRNKEIYQKMKNKTVYSMKSDITAHSMMNSL